MCFFMNPMSALNFELNEFLNGLMTPVDFASVIMEKQEV